MKNFAREHIHSDSLNVSIFLQNCLYGLVYSSKNKLYTLTPKFKIMYDTLKLTELAEIKLKENMARTVYVLVASLIFSTLRM